MEAVLVTGGTGTLGRAVVRRLLAEGEPVRVLSRQAHTPGDHAWAVGDLVTGQGVATAVAGARVVVHLATTNGRRDVAAARRLAGAATAAGVPHLLYVSIVGIDRVPLPYYRAKLAAEREVEHAGTGWTVLRATQFHDLLLRLMDGSARLPVMPVPAGLRFQPVDVRDVAGRLAELVAVGPSGRVADFGGPEVRAFEELARSYLAARGLHRPLLPVRLPGRTFRAYREGRHLAPEHRDGRITFERVLAERYHH
ncbi:SDR family oxidoreductase [Kitasatospora camelliae]|uniref:SDR family oxidoreductase n=1 Tax=Kitasatospora camelliae TaxID=3156397 RepID=A0AAU8K0P9_9ACTN